MADETPTKKSRKRAAPPPPDGGGLPAFDHEAQCDVLGTLLLDPVAIHRVRPILKKPEDFYGDAHQTIYAAILGQVADGQPVDMNTVRSRLRATGGLDRAGGINALSDLTRTRPHVENIVAYATRIAACARMRALSEWGDRVKAEAKSAPDIRAYSEEKLRELSLMTYSDGANGQVRHISGGIEASMAAAQQRRLTGILNGGTPTGFAGIDKKTGGIGEGDLWIIAGRPGQGKTSLAIGMARNISEPIPDYAPLHIPRRGVVIFELEMPEIQIADRLVCMDTNIPFANWRNGRIIEDMWGPANASAEAICKSYLFIEDTPGMDMNEIEAKLVALQAEFNMPATFAGCPLCTHELLYYAPIGRWHCPACHPNPTAALAVTHETRTQLTREEKIADVFVDHIGIVKGDPNAFSREGQIESISNHLKAMAKRRKVGVGALCQLNRAVETRQSKDKRPQLSDLRGCLTGDTIILDAMSRAPATMAQLAQGERPLPLVFAMGESGESVETAQVARAWSTGKQPVFQLITKDGCMIRATANHPFRTENGWTELRDLREGQFVATQAYDVLQEGQTVARRVYDTIRWSEVWSIGQAGEEEVFDLNVPGLHNFVANGIFVHNSGSIEQDADVVLMPYRPGYYEPENAKIQTEAEIIIAKQRNGPPGKVTMRYTPECSRFDDEEALPEYI